MSTFITDLFGFFTSAKKFIYFQGGLFVCKQNCAKRTAPISVKLGGRAVKSRGDRVGPEMEFLCCVMQQLALAEVSTLQCCTP